MSISLPGGEKSCVLFEVVSDGLRLFEVVSNGLKKNRAMARLYFKGSKVQGCLRWFQFVYDGLRWFLQFIIILSLRFRNIFYICHP